MDSAITLFVANVQFAYLFHYTIYFHTKIRNSYPKNVNYLLAGLISAQRLRIEDRLTDLNNQPIDVSITK